MADRYTIEIFYSEDDRGYIAVVPELPGCSAFGESEEDAIREVKIAIDLWIETAKKENREIPKPFEKKIEIKPDTTGENMKLQFLLFKNGELYRDLHLWINVTE